MKLYLGIDWSQSKHDICFLNQGGFIRLIFKALRERNEPYAGTGLTRNTSKTAPLLQVFQVKLSPK
jgi:hypothetical protein